MPPQGRLIDQIRQKVDAGQLPSYGSNKVWNAYGMMLPCDACEAKILPTQVEYSFTIRKQLFRFHVGCYGLWEAERRRQSVGRVALSKTLGARTRTCIDCHALGAGVSVDSLMSGLLRLSDEVK